MAKGPVGRYRQIIERIFVSRYTNGASEVVFAREDIVATANELGIELPKNVGDVLYSFRYRQALPEEVAKRAPAGHAWIIRSAGRSRYRFVAVRPLDIQPNANLAEIKIPDATPGIIAMHALTDEQALLAKVRYNRLLDVFTGVTCYSLQSHLRTQVATVQAETDEIYVGVDKRGAQYVFPVQAKGGSDKLSQVQIEQDLAVCGAKFPQLIARPVGAQFMAEDLIALFEFEETRSGLAITDERHYRLVPPDELTDEDLAAYRARASQEP